MNLLRIWSWFNNSPAPSTAAASPDMLSSGSLEDIEDPWLEIYFKLKEFHAIEHFDELGDCVFKIFCNMGKKLENDFAGRLLLASLGKMMKEKEELYNKIEQIQMQLTNLKVAKCVLEENLLSSSHRAQVAENQTEALIIRLADDTELLSSHTGIGGGNFLSGPPGFHSQLAQGERHSPRTGEPL